MIAKELFIKLFCRIIGTFTIGGAVYACIYNPHISSISPLNKVILILVAIYTGTIIFLLPVFMARKLISSDYYNASKYKKAKSNLFMLKIFSPFWVYFFIPSYIVIGFNVKLLLLAIILVYLAISASYTIRKENKL